MQEPTITELLFSMTKLPEDQKAFNARMEQLRERNDKWTRDQLEAIRNKGKNNAAA